MATKADLLTVLDGVYDGKVQSPEPIGQGTTWNGKTKISYQSSVLQVTNNLGKILNVPFFVLNEGLPDEEAYFDMDRAPAELRAIT